MKQGAEATGDHIDGDEYLEQVGGEAKKIEKERQRQDGAAEQAGNAGDTLSDPDPRHRRVTELRRRRDDLRRLTPFVATWLIAVTGNSLSPSFYIMFTAALSIIALAFVGRRRYPR
jgi:hypothetical protein